MTNPTDTLNPITFVDAVRRAGGHLWPHDDLHGFIIWTEAGASQLFLEELQHNIMAAPVNARAQVACYLAEHPSKCDRPPFCTGS